MCQEIEDHRCPSLSTPPSPAAAARARTPTVASTSLRRGMSGGAAVWQNDRTPLLKKKIGGKAADLGPFPEPRALAFVVHVLVVLRCCDAAGAPARPFVSQ